MKIFEVTQSINKRKKNCGCGQDPCKTYGIQEAGKYADPGGDATQFDRMKRVQQMNRAGVDTSTATTDITRSSYAGIDPEDLQAKKLKDRTKKVQKDIEQREKEKNRDLIPICTYYMRRRKPHTIVRLEFPKKYLSTEFRSELDFAISCVAWQHELGTKVPHVQEFADRQCQLQSEAQILRKVTASRLSQEGLETLEVYE